MLRTFFVSRLQETAEWQQIPYPARLASLPCPPFKGGEGPLAPLISSMAIVGGISSVAHLAHQGKFLGLSFCRLAESCPLSVLLEANADTMLVKAAPFRPTTSQLAGLSSSRLAPSSTGNAKRSADLQPPASIPHKAPCWDRHLLAPQVSPSPLGLPASKPCRNPRDLRPLH